MYGYLVLKDDKSIDTIFMNWMPLLRNSLSSTQEKEALKVLDALCPLKDPLRKQVDIEEFKQVFSHVPSNVMSFGVDLWLAHLRLPELTRKLRLAAIDGILSAYLDGLEPIPDLGPVRLNLRRMALLVPDSLQDCDIRDDRASFLESNLAQTNLFKEKLQPLLGRIMFFVKELPADRFQRLQDHVWKTVCTRRHEEREAAANSLLQLFQAELVVARAQGVAGLAGVDGVGTKVVGGAHLLERAGGHQQFRDRSVHDGRYCPAKPRASQGAGSTPLRYGRCGRSRRHRPASR